MFLKNKKKHTAVLAALFLTINGQHPNVSVGEKQYTTGLLTNT